MKDICEIWKTAVRGLVLSKREILRKELGTCDGLLRYAINSCGFVDVGGAMCFTSAVAERRFIEIGREITRDEKNTLELAIFHEVAHLIQVVMGWDVDHGPRWVKVVSILGAPEEGEVYRDAPPLPWSNLISGR